MDSKVVISWPVERQGLRTNGEKKDGFESDVVGLAANALEDTFLLALHGADPRGKQPAQTEPLALLDSEGRRLVGGGMEQQVESVVVCVL